MGKIADLFINISADTRGFSRSMNNVEKKIMALGSKMQSAGRKFTLGLTVPLVGVGVAAVKAFGDFDKAMTESLAIMGDVSDVMRKDMADAAREMSERSTFAAKELGEAYFFLASAGLNATQSIKALPVVMRFAQAGAFNLASATDLLTDAQTALGLSTKDATQNQENMIRVSDVLVKANTLANASVQQFSEALTNRAAAALVNVNKKLEEGVAVLAAFADKGVKGQIAGQQLAMMLNALDIAARKNNAAWKKYNLSLFDAQGEMRSVGDIIGDLEGLLGNMTTQQRAATLAQLGFNVRTKASILTLMGSSEKIKQWTKDLKDAGGATEEVANKQMKAFSNQMAVLKNMVVNVAASLGEQLVPIIKKLVDDHIKPAVKWFNNLSEETKLLIVKVAGLVAVMGPLLMLSGRLLTTFVTLKAVTPLLAASFGTLGIAIATAYGAYKLLIAAREKWEKATGSFTAEETTRWAELNRQIGGWTTFMEKAAKKFKDVTKGADAYRLKMVELNDIWDQYGQNTEETFKAIAKGTHGQDLKRFLEELGGKHLDAAQAASDQGDALSDLEKEAGRLIGAITKGLNEGLDNLQNGLTDSTEKAGNFAEMLAETVVPAMNNMAGVAYNTQETLKSHIFNANDEIKKNYKTTIKEVKSFWDQMADGLQTKWASTLGEVLRGATSLKEGLKGIWDAILVQFTDMIGAMIAKWITDFVGKIIDGAKSAGQEIAESIGSAIGDTDGGGIAGAFKSVGAAAGGLLSTLTGIASIITAIASVASLFKKQGIGSTAEWHLQEIWKNTKELRDYTFINIRQHFIDLKEYLSDILKPIIRIKDRAKEQVGILGDISKGISKLADIFSNINFGQHGLNMQVSKPTLFMAGERGPEHVAIEPSGQPAAGAMPGSIDVTLNAPIYLDGMQVGMALAKRSVKLSKYGHLKLHERGLTDR